MPKDDALHLTASDTWEDCATFAKVGNQLAVSVSEEKAVDSYNQTFECTIHLSPEQIEQLCKWLATAYPRP